MLSSKSSSHRRLFTRVAIAGAIAAAPIAAVAVPAFADTPSATQIDWHDHDGPGPRHDHDHDHDRGPGGWQGGPGGPGGWQGGPGGPGGPGGWQGGPGGPGGFLPPPPSGSAG
ncbi:hypothetical protein AB0L57_06760 [Nocardia sp. NPDC052254]|uniref:hypothetical protein n=1 Tax=Nocardia sp. NPDC052254 TaxID=3155681 RepID=UPI00343D84E5